jgi:hypothetical protein
MAKSTRSCLLFDSGRGVRPGATWGLCVAILLVLGLCAPPARAGTITFSYSGLDVTGFPGGGSSVGSGSFSFADSPSTVGLAGLTSFAFTQTTTLNSPLEVSSFNYGLADLQTFSATL